MKSARNWRGIIIKVVTLLVAVTMMLSLLAGCEGDKAEEKETSSQQEKKETGDKAEAPSSSKVSDKPISFSILYADNASQPFDESWPVIDAITEKTNVELDIQLVPDSDYQEKLKILLNTGEVPDIITKLGAGEYQEYALNGSFLAISDYMDMLPNFSSLIKKWGCEEEMELTCTMPDGKNYWLCGLTDAPIYNNGLIIRGDLVDKYGFDAPETYDDLYLIMKKLKEEYPDSIPFTQEYGMDCLWWFSGRQWGIDAGWSSGNGFYFNPETDAFEHVYTSEGYKAAISYWAKCYEEGLFDQEIFSQTVDQVVQKLSTEKAFVSFVWGDQIGGLNTNLKENLGGDAHFELFLPVAGSTGKRATGILNKLPPGRGFVLPKRVAEEDYFPTLMKFCDWFYSEEGYTTCSWGIEGVSYKVENGEKVFVDEILNAPSVSSKLAEDYGLYNNSLTLCLPGEFVLNTISPEIAEVAQQALDGGMISSPRPSAKLQPEELEEEKLLKTPLNDYCKQMETKFILGEVSIQSDWDEFVKQCDEKGRKRLAEIYAKAWERQK